MAATMHAVNCGSDTVVFINGKRVQFQDDVEKGLRDDLDAALRR
jgi:hypothetical protein